MKFESHQEASEIVSAYLRAIEISATKREIIKADEPLGRTAFLLGYLESTVATMLLENPKAAGKLMQRTARLLVE